MARVSINWIQTDEAVSELSSDGTVFEVEVFHPDVWERNDEMREANADLHRKFEIRIMGHLEMSVPLSVSIFELEPEADGVEELFRKHYGEKS